MAWERVALVEEGGTRGHDGVGASDHGSLPAPSPAVTYLPHVDGLRALALTAVLACHLHLGCPGGFLRVDASFVPSGCLISRSIVPSMVAARYSLTACFLRPYWRLAPASVATVAGVVAAAAVLYPPRLARAAGVAAVDTLTANANALYMVREGGYGDSSKVAKAMLPTWSLAVEEQFRLMWPSLLLALLRGGHAAGVAETASPPPLGGGSGACRRRVGGWRDHARPALCGWGDGRGGRCHAAHTG